MFIKADFIDYEQDKKDFYIDGNKTEVEHFLKMTGCKLLVGLPFKNIVKNIFFSTLREKKF